MKIENDFLGLREINGDCVVTGRVWEKAGEMSIYTIHTNSNKVKRAFNYGKRYSMEKTVKLLNSKLKKDETEKLRALLYRAKVSENKRLALRQRGAVMVGVI